MRLDKYLKITRLIKRRTVANEACDGGRILVNGKVARASYAVKEGDLIEIQMGNKPLKVKVLSVSEYATKESASQMYRVEERFSSETPAKTDETKAGEERQFVKFDKYFPTWLTSAAGSGIIIAT